ncbi:unnamed protein product [Staurois parvus]|uniref:Uncharacterized protein n=1 Tax=Staurois parvus TaxID=386267 RepID=A0ABN9CCK7_9NEOB|nr:unnamed protein product [Staurois parvus]
MCMRLQAQSVLAGGHLNKRKGRENRTKEPFYSMCTINPLGSLVGITSMLYCQGRTDNSWAPGQ